MRAANDESIRDLAARRARLRRRYLALQADTAEAEELLAELGHIDCAILATPAADAAELSMKVTLAASEAADRLAILEGDVVLGILSDVRRLTDLPALEPERAEALRRV